MDRILIAGMGNVLRADNGFGVEVVRRLAQHADFPDGVDVVEVGSGGITLVQKLFDGYDFLIIVDAARRGKPPGTVSVLEPHVPDIAGRSWEELGGLLGDLHETDPSRVLLLARALGTLPKKVLIVGCEPDTTDELRTALSAPVAGAVAEASDRVVSLVGSWVSRERRVSGA
jgi:hydrogenase maturation protease